MNFNSIPKELRLLINSYFVDSLPVRSLICKLVSKENSLMFFETQVPQITYIAPRMNYYTIDHCEFKDVLSQACFDGYVNIYDFLNFGSVPIAVAAACGGNIQMVQHLGCWDRTMSYVAASSGHFQLLKWAKDQGYEITPDIVVSAASGGHMDIIEWIGYVPHCETVPELLAKFGDLNKLQMAVNLGYKLTVQVMKEAAEGGHFDILQWSREQGCPWNVRVCSSAVQGGQLEILKWLRQEGCPWDYVVCNGAFEHGYVEVFRWILTNGFTETDGICDCACEYNRLDFLQVARSFGCPWDESTCAAGARNFEILRYLKDHGCPWDNCTFIEAVSEGKREVLEWLYENKCPWSEEVCTAAAYQGDLETLQWLRQHGCPWDENTCDVASEKGHDDVLFWAIRNGCPWEVNEEDMSEGDEELWDEIVKQRQLRSN